MIDFELSDFSRKQVIVAFLAAGMLAGAGAAYLGLNADKIPQKQAGQQVVTTLEAQTGQNLELINVESESGLYKVNVRDSNDQVSTFYVTKDGSKIASNVADLGQTRRVALARNSLSQCLQDRNVVMFGNISQRETQAQIQLLGGQRRISGIYADVNNQQVLQQAARAGVRQVPAFFYNGSVRQGVTTPGQLANFTGCSYDVDIQ